MRTFTILLAVLLPLGLFSQSAKAQCVDADEDGYNAYDETNCPEGNDCCDTGDETIDGCAPETADQINPGQKELCGDSLDNNCVGGEADCPPCTADAGSLDCAAGVITSSTLGEQQNLVQNYCGYGDIWIGKENIFEYSPSEETAIIMQVVALDPNTQTEVHAPDVFVLSSYNDEGTVCNPSACIATTGPSFGGYAQTTFFASADEKYFIAFDQRDFSVDGTATIAVSCIATGQCQTVDETMECDLNGSYSTTGLSNDVEYFLFPTLGPDWTGLIEPTFDTIVTIRASIGKDPDTDALADLDLFIVEDDGEGNCLPRNLIALAATAPAAEDTVHVEETAFQATAGTKYYVILDGYLATTDGPFDLEVTTDPDCGEATMCGCSCKDLTSDPESCGACFNSCAANVAANVGEGNEHVASYSCSTGVCGIETCDTDYGDCDNDYSNGCEAHLKTDALNCNSCGQACTSEQFPYCVDGKCTGQCQGDDVDCGGDCVDINSDTNHCGECNNVCSYLNAEALCVVGDQGPECQMGTCTEGYADCDGATTLGCETVLGTIENCGGCASANAAFACVFANASAMCNGGVCAMGQCDEGYHDCNAENSDGCEQVLGSDDHCAACDNACGANAACEQLVCVCDDGYGDCDQEAGCETDIRIDEAHCGACGTACAPNNSVSECVDRVCVLQSCNEHYDDCDQAIENGCETDLRSKSNCAACGTECGLFENCLENNGVYQCSDLCEDVDEDGFADKNCEEVQGPDCDDTDALINPDADERCNALDDDCDGQIDESFDKDKDGFIDKTCGGTATDCNDENAAVNPDANEICDKIDNNCDGTIDEGCGCVDADKDGYDDKACGGDDCVDTNPNINPGSPELCNEIDDNCDGDVDEQNGKDVCSDGTNAGCSTFGSNPKGLWLWIALGLLMIRRRS